MSSAKDLLEYIDWSSLECLNEQHSHPATNVLKQGYRSVADHGRHVLLCTT
jgi:hypothetical protein